MKAKASATGSLPSRRLMFIRGKPGASALGLDGLLLYISVQFLPPLLLLEVLLGDQYRQVHHL